MNGINAKSAGSGRRLRNSRGFTLAEILIAIGILLVGMTGVIAVYAVAVDFHRRAVDNSSMALLAENMLHEITADFGRRDVNFDGETTFAESFVDLACRYKCFNDDGSLDHGEGVAAPNMRGFNVEVSLYPLPRNVLEIVAADEVEFDDWIADYWDWQQQLPDSIDDDLRDLLAGAVQYKLVVRIIRGTGPERQTDAFETILVPKDVD